MLKFENPFFKSATALKVEQHKPAVVAWLQGQPGNKVITLAEMRAGLPAIAADLSRAVVNQLCAEMGALVQNPDDGTV